MADSAATEGLAEQLRTVKLSTEQQLSELFLRFTAREGKLQGFAGVWTFFRPDSAEESSHTSRFLCIRTYEVLAGQELHAAATEPPVVSFRTFNETPPQSGRALRRPKDGVYESMYQRAASDTFFTNTMILSDSERQGGLPGCLHWRCIAFDSENVVRMAPSLPSMLHRSEDGERLQIPGLSAETTAQATFAFEFFIEHAGERWAMGALYSVQTLQLVAHFCIQEQLILLDPEAAIQFDSMPFRTPRPRLDEDVEQWLHGGTFKGEMSEIVWDEDGDSLKLPPRPASWTPPDTESDSHRLFLYKDSVYAYYPLRLPSVDESSANTFNSGARFEVGGICTVRAEAGKEDPSAQEEFRRLLLRYTPAGHAASLTREVYKMKGSFDYEKRQSTSVRRSMDMRQGHPNYGGQQLMARKRMEQRLRGMEQAFERNKQVQAEEAAKSAGTSL